MQVTSKELYKQVELNTGEDLALIKSIGNVVFKRLSEFLKRPDSLIVRLKGVGLWYLRNKKLRIYLRNKEDLVFLPTPEQPSEKYLSRKEEYLKMQEREEEYKRFLAKKAAIREIRHPLQPYLIPKNQDEDDS